MPRSKEIPEDLRKKVIEAHQSGKGYKLIAGSLDLQISTIRSIVRKWKMFGTVTTRPRSGRPPKISAKERDNIICEVRRNPCTTPKNLQASLASANIHVHDSTIRRILGKHLRPVLLSYDGRTKFYTEEKVSAETSEEFIQNVKAEEGTEDCTGGNDGLETPGEGDGADNKHDTDVADHDHDSRVN